MRLLLADDHGLFRDSMSVWLRQLERDIHIDFADSYATVMQILQGGKYHLLMLDLDMPGMQGAYSVRRLRRDFPGTPMVVVSANESPLVIRACLEAGAAGYVTKSSEGDTILQAVRQVLSGAEYVPLCARIDKDDQQYDFTEKQMALLALLAEGRSNRDIAAQMHLSEGTIKQYVTRLLRELNVDNRMQAGLKAKKLLGIG